MVRAGLGGRSFARPALVLLVAFLALDLLLVAIVLRDPTPPGPAIAEVAPRAPALTDVTATPAAAPTPAGSVDQPAATDAAVEPDDTVPVPDDPMPVRERPLTVVSSDEAFRARIGSCPGGGGRVERTTNGGRTWRVVDSPQAVLRLGHDLSTFHVRAVGRECEYRASSYLTSTDTWRRLADTENIWHMLVEADATKLRAPDRSVRSPCAPRATLELEVVRLVAVVLCENGQLYRSIDHGASWKGAGHSPEAEAMAAPTVSTILVASRATEACEGVYVTEIDGPGYCLQQPGKGRLALAAHPNGKDAMLLVGQDVFTYAGGKWAVTSG